MTNERGAAPVPAGGLVPPRRVDTGRASPGTWGAGGGGGVLEEIGEEDCLALLGGERVGRLVVSGRPPHVFPVNFVLDGRAVVMRTAAGTKLDAVRRDAEVCFEVDNIDRVAESGWSVVVTGHVREEIHIHDGSPQPRPEPWSAGVRAYWLRLTPTAMTGRRVRPGPRRSAPPATAGHPGR
ncbi:MAG TPA: pyridoxamine 5'-phosphate oxidase family protein [Acidimicrobiales bacterium]|nr:pyridoxamine 5'-phosphate oxidase family protein [Acidimicrobiales bacterium]